jgi:hypothetical protein
LRADVCNKSGPFDRQISYQVVNATKEKIKVVISSTPLFDG